MNNKTIAYLRVSTVEQDLEKNKADILSFANNKDFGRVKFVEEKVSGTKSWKSRKIKKVIDDLNKVDRLIVPEFSRLGRSMLEIMEMLSILKDKEVNVYAVKGGWELNGSLQSKVMAISFSIASEIERDLIPEFCTKNHRTELMLLNTALLLAQTKSMNLQMLNLSGESL